MKVTGVEQVHNVFKGIVVGFIGLIIWLLVSIPLGIGDAVGVARDPLLNAVLYLGFALMVGGPVVYIVILPMWSWWRARTR